MRTTTWHNLEIRCMCNDHRDSLPVLNLSSFLLRASVICQPPSRHPSSYPCKLLGGHHGSRGAPCGDPSSQFALHLSHTALQPPPQRSHCSSLPTVGSVLYCTSSRCLLHTSDLHSLFSQPHSRHPLNRLSQLSSYCHSFYYFCCLLYVQLSQDFM